MRVTKVNVCSVIIQNDILSSPHNNYLSQIRLNLCNLHHDRTFENTNDDGFNQELADKL